MLANAASKQYGGAISIVNAIVKMTKIKCDNCIATKSGGCIALQCNKPSAFLSSNKTKDIQCDLAVETSFFSNLVA